jgi:hypothetical protein
MMHPLHTFLSLARLAGRRRCEHHVPSAIPMLDVVPVCKNELVLDPVCQQLALTLVAHWNPPLCTVAECVMDHFVGCRVDAGWVDPVFGPLACHVVVRFAHLLTLYVCTYMSVWSMETTLVEMPVQRTHLTALPSSVPVREILVTYRCTYVLDYLASHGQQRAAQWTLPGLSQPRQHKCILYVHGMPRSLKNCLGEHVHHWNSSVALG